MREILSNEIARAAKDNEDFVLLTGDHGYALFDELRKVASDKFVNVGIMEQGLVSFAAGMTKVGLKPLCYGLASFVPLRVLEQIKFDVCLPKHPVKFIGDGAGLVYTNLGNSHQCAEDIGVLSTLPEIEIYTPGDNEEMRVCFKEFLNSSKPAYLRVGKADQGQVNETSIQTTEPYFQRRSTSKKDVIVSIGPMLGKVKEIAEQLNLSHISVMRVKPLHENFLEMIEGFERIIFIEEHVQIGGISSHYINLCEKFSIRPALIKSFSLKSSFTSGPGTYESSLFQHGLTKEQIINELR